MQAQIPVPVCGDVRAASAGAAACAIVFCLPKKRRAGWGVYPCSGSKAQPNVSWEQWGCCWVPERCCRPCVAHGDSGRAKAPVENLSEDLLEARGRGRGSCLLLVTYWAQCRGHGQVRGVGHPDPLRLAVLQLHMALWDAASPSHNAADQGESVSGLWALQHGPSVAALQPVPGNGPSVTPLAGGSGDLLLLLSPLARHLSSLLLTRELSSKALRVRIIHFNNKRKFAQWPTRRGGLRGGKMSERCGQ